MEFDFEEKLRVGRERLKKVYNYLQALNQHRNPVITDIKEQKWLCWLRQLPNHPSIVLGRIAQESNAGLDIERDDFILKVRRPKLTSAPNPPEELLQWLESGWDKPEKEISVKPTINDTNELNETIIIQFADTGLDEQLMSWKTLRDQWVVNEIPARNAMKVFERFYELYGWLQKEGERIEIVLGDGILYWNREQISINHPLLLLRLELEFDTSIPEFRLTETEHGVELYTAVLNTLEDIDGQIIANCREELQNVSVHPLGGDDTSGFLKRLIVLLSPSGELVELGAEKHKLDEPQMVRNPVVFARSRTQGFSITIDNILVDLSNEKPLPEHLLGIVGVNSYQEGSVGARDDISTKKEKWDESEEVLLGKPANSEQLAIAKALQNQPGVLVQGPPGTGKTHTIANLIGHLLAQGKSILVTSHTTKALRVLHRQVENELQPLCVSVLDNDTESRQMLQVSIENIVSRLSSSNTEDIKNSEDFIAAKRNTIIQQIKQARQELKNARANEYRPLMVGGESYDPSEAARKISLEKGNNDWIPKPVELGAPLPLSVSEIVELYRTNISISKDDEEELLKNLPQPSGLLTPSEFKALIEGLNYYKNLELSPREELWKFGARDLLPEYLENITKKLLTTVNMIDQDVPWKSATIFAGFKGLEHRKPWDNLVKMVQDLMSEATSAKEIIYSFQPVVTEYLTLEEQVAVVERIIEYCQDGQKISQLCLLTHPAWKKFIQNSTVRGKSPSSLEHFNALKIYIQLKLHRRELAARWDTQFYELKAPLAQDLGEEIELGASQFCISICNCLNWYQEAWLPMEQILQEMGFEWRILLEESQPRIGLNGELFRLKDMVCGILQNVLLSQAKYIRLQNLEQTYENLQKTLSLVGNDCTRVVTNLKSAVRDQDVILYRTAFERLVDLYNRNDDLKLRRELLLRLEKVAPGWASAIRSRIGVHGEGQLPGDVKNAWLWRQIYDELDQRGQVSMIELQQKVELLGSELRKLTTLLIECRAWSFQIKRTNSAQRQSLMGYLELMKRIGKGTGKRVPRLRAELRGKLTESRSAVPVWIMPLSRVAESFDPRVTRFDVLIIDEASQCDVMGLIAFYLAKEVIVVGDDEQVSPLAVGQKVSVVQHLIDEHLQGIPNQMLYDGQMSVYELAKTSFGSTVRLLEHFRSVPQIIQFSNQLSYNGDIKPLRDANEVNLKPHLIGYQVEGATSNDKVNMEEAYAIASLLVAATEQEEYDTKTFGVISLLGDDQAIEIERILRNHIYEESYERHRIICGNAAHFQGDERDVMFLSVVTASTQPVRMLGEGTLGMYKKRFNVAASRARDQMWVVYSTDPCLFQTGDLRRRLIEHVKNPDFIEEKITQAEGETESVFEKEVLRRLMYAGYKVIPQWRVGNYSIDLVVEYKGRKLAIECDGDRYHTLDNLAQDMERQAILERLGWKFVRIRGSLFFREPETAMEPVFKKLTELDIKPTSDLHESTSQRDNKGEELKERIIRRAAELRREWRGQDDQTSFEDDSKSTLNNQNSDHVMDDEYIKIDKECLDVEEDATPTEIDLPPKIEDTKFNGIEVLVLQSPSIDKEDKTNEQMALFEDEIMDLNAFFLRRGIETIDKRQTGGSYWVLGNSNLKSLLEELSLKGLRFKYMEKGVKPTDFRPAWFLVNS